MDYFRICNDVIEIFNEVEREIRHFKNSTAIECVEFCGGECCNKEDIFATILEFIPLAFHLHNINKAEEKYYLLKSKGDKICILYDKENSGRCEYYEYRGLVCRLFGFASIRLKDNSPSMVTCRFIKSRYIRQIESQLNPIVMADYQRRLMAIDIELGCRFYPINEAIQKAIEKIGLYIMVKDFLSQE
ncbi:MAG: YkgJ family cysteine cluster protein [Myxococcota bacterium]